MRDCAGLEPSESSELVSAGPGEGGFGGAMGKEEIRRLCPRASPGLMASFPGRGVEPPPRLCWNEGALPEGFREMLGRYDVSTGVPKPPVASVFGKGESRLKERAEMVLWWPAGNSAPGMGDGAAEPLTAAAAFRSSSLT